MFFTSYFTLDLVLYLLHCLLSVLEERREGCWRLCLLAADLTLQSEEESGERQLNDSVKHLLFHSLNILMTAAFTENKKGPLRLKGCRYIPVHTVQTSNSPHLSLLAGISDDLHLCS